MLAECYVISAQCDRTGAHVAEVIPREQFTGPNRRAARAALTRGGWRVYVPTSGDVVLCPACVAAGHTTAADVVALRGEGEQ